MPAKIFVFGSINGHLRSAFGKLETLTAKNSFSFALVAGNLFSPESAKDDSSELTALLNGSINVPCPTYFTVGTHALPARVVERICNHGDDGEDEIVPNLHFLGKRSITKTSEGVRIVVLGGAAAASDSDAATAGLSLEQHLPQHTADDAKVLRGANHADILLTAAWPADVWRNSPKAKDMAAKKNFEHVPASGDIADLCAVLKPRYHLTMSPPYDDDDDKDFFFEREPFFPPEAADEAEKGKGIALTRFISLAAWGNKSKAKTMYAFNLSTEAGGSTIVTPPVGSTLTPFYARSASQGGGKRSADQAGMGAGVDGYSRFATGESRPGHRDRFNNKRRKQHQQRPPPGPSECFFCLSNADMTKHMVCSIGDDAYIATAKGPLPSATTFQEQGLDFPCHVIITPHRHAPTLSAAVCGGETELKGIYSEMRRFRESLSKMVATRSAGRLGTVAWEISRQRNIHVHWQLIPVTTDMVRGGQVEAGFRVLAADLLGKGVEGRFEKRAFDTADGLDGGGDYLRVWTWAGAEGGAQTSTDQPAAKTVAGESLLLRLDESIRFDLQFPRKVMAKLLGLEKRTVWQDVEQTREDEEQDVAKLRGAFAEWDFTLEG